MRKGPLEDYKNWIDKLEKRPGAYAILNIPDNIHYVGSSVNVKYRVSEHLTNLIVGNFLNARLGRDFKRLGMENFYAFVFEYCDVSELQEKENYYMYAVEETYNVRGAHVGAHRRGQEKQAIIRPTTMHISRSEKDKMDRIALKELGIKNRNGLLRKWINLYNLD